MLSEKYLAGLLDADGYIGVRARVGARPDIEVCLSQKIMRAHVVEDVAAEFGGHIRRSKIGDGEYITVAMRSGPAKRCVERLAKYMVIKGGFAKFILDLVDKAEILRTPDDVKECRQMVRQARHERHGYERNFPSRKWLAGYFDGDGCFSVKFCRKTGYAYPQIAILAAPYYDAGIELIKKCFGGTIVVGKDGNRTWRISLSQPSKAKQVIGYFSDHLECKKATAYYLLGCAENGNFRDGKTVQQVVKTLNAQQHRLSDPEGVAARFVKATRFDIEKQRIGRPPKR
jgi:hypothetical protein